MRTLLLALVLAVPTALAQSKPEQPPADVPPCPSTEDSPNVVALVQRIERLMEGRSSISVMTMAIETPAWQRTLKMQIWAKGQDYALIRILEGGPRETGMMTLKREKQLWNYLPKAGRVMKLPSGMLGDSWMGSDFTNDDLVRGSSMTRDYVSTVDRVGEHEGRQAWFITLKPKPNSTVVWGKVELVLDRQSCVPLLERFYDEEGVVARTMSFSELKQVGWRTFPTKLTVIPAEKGRKTSMTYERIEFDVDVPDDTFTLRRLQQGGT